MHNKPIFEIMTQIASDASMHLITSHMDGTPSFRLIPLTNDCPFSEGIFIPQTNALIMLSVALKDNLHMVPVRDDQGDVAKSKKPRLRRGADGKPEQVDYREKQIVLQGPTEYYITEKEEVKKFIALVAKNVKDFDYEKFFTSDIIVPETPKIILPGQ